MFTMTDMKSVLAADLEAAAKAIVQLDDLVKALASSVPEVKL